MCLGELHTESNFMREHSSLAHHNCGCFTKYFKIYKHYKKQCILWQLFSYKVAFITVTIYACGSFSNRHRTGRHKV